MKYLHLELFPQIQIKAGKEVSLCSLLASLWGFQIYRAQKVIVFWWTQTA
jgi:hypothetical protein